MLAKSKSKSLFSQAKKVLNVKLNQNYQFSTSKIQKQSSKSFVMNMFLGKVDTTQVLPYPRSLDEEQTEMVEALVDPFSKFMTEVNNPAKNDQDAEIEPKTLQGLKEMGAFGLQVPVDLDGLGLTNTQYARLVEIVGSSDLGVGIALGAHQSIGFKGILLRGNPEQKAKYLPTLATGEKFAAFCLTEPASGSDAASIQTRAVKTEDGKAYILNGGKIWISNGGIADIFTVFAKTQVKNEDGTLTDKVSAFIVERGFGGITSGPPEQKMGIKCSNTAEVHFEDVRVPVENILGKEGDGFKIAMHILNNGRFGMAGALSGTMKSLILQATDHATNRTQFGKKLYEFNGIKEKLARMSILHYVTESMAYIVCGSMDAGYDDFQLEAAISKIFASEAAWSVADECIQILGGMGYMKDCGAERVMRDLRIFRIFEGTNDILRFFLALTGVQYYGKTNSDVTKSLKSPLTNLPTLLKFSGNYVSKRAGLYSSSNELESNVHSNVKSSAKLASEVINRFGITVEDLALKHQKKFIGMQSHQTVLANCCIDIFAMVAVVSRASDSANRSVESASNEARMCNIWCQEAHKRVKENLKLLSCPQFGDRVKDMGQLSDTLIQTQKPIPVHPLGF